MSELSQAPRAEAALTGRGLLRSAGWVTGSHLLAQIFAYGSLILLARWLTPTSFGTVAIGTAIVYVAVLFVDHGTLGGIIIRPHLSRADLIRAFRRCMITAAALAAVMAALAGLVVTKFASGGDAAAVALLALCLPLHAIAVVPTALLQKSMQFRRLAGINATANVVSALAAVLMALDGFGVWALVARQLMVFGVLAVLTPGLCLGAWRAHQLTARPVVDGANRATGGERWFFVFGVALMITANLDYLVIGGSGNAHVVGLYALAFTIAMAPSTHISEQVGRVLFAAAALQPQNSRARTEQSVRLMAMVFVPLLPVGILLTPTVLPAVLGDQWKPIVVTFQILLIVGVGQAIVNCIGEALSGNGHIEFRAKVMAIRCAATLLALLILVPVDGIRGAALAQLLVFLPYAAVYCTAGARRAGTSAAALGRQLRPVVSALLAQVATSGVVLWTLSAFTVSGPVAVCAAASAGLVVCGALLYWFGIRKWQP
jgi:O-antigen/teichoic acid export membrane protein